MLGPSALTMKQAKWENVTQQCRRISQGLALTPVGNAGLDDGLDEVGERCVWLPPLLQGIHHGPTVRPRCRPVVAMSTVGTARSQGYELQRSFERAQGSQGHGEQRSLEDRLGTHMLTTSFVTMTASDLCGSGRKASPPALADSVPGLGNPYSFIFGRHDDNLCKGDNARL